MPDAMDQDAIRRCRKPTETCVARFTVRPTELHFYELVILQCAFRFGDHGGGHAGIADEQNRVQYMPQSPEKFSLAF